MLYFLAPHFVGDRNKANGLSFTMNIITKYKDNSFSKIHTRETSNGQELKWKKTPMTSSNLQRKNYAEEEKYMYNKVTTFFGLKCFYLAENILPLFTGRTHFLVLLEFVLYIKHKTFFSLPPKRIRL